MRTRKFLEELYLNLKNFVMHKLKPMRIYKVGKRTAKNYNEWMKHIIKQLNKLKLNKNA